ncbi:hypothetical protein BDV27DRAFT_147647 [Aspergillus caelatus]|uniref:Major facilitator superfamily (MFS) profile domain-containing protein n=1 Tax=Aspergillus caelatus TaxID=61420 RepID=A0A5N6ZW93_9EURO|nr:uncharacterized protein BDV27DRAFT_147647 [Aspergillus caelatus]KAE8361638.1 hypothetical protein BDV27DRAFT_147647 [Aspergillus caelatus]
MLQSSLHTSDHMARTKSSEPELTINLTEPAVFIPTYTHKPAVLRGSCELKVKETLMVKRLTVNFHGVSHVHWPHGLHDSKTITDRTLTVFGPAISGTGPQHHADQENLGMLETGSTECNTSRQKCGLWGTITNKLCSRCKSTAAPDYQLLSPGTYTYNFEMILPPQLPESVNVRRSHVRYNVRACLEFPGHFRHNIVHNMPIAAIHCPAEDFVEDAEPVYIARAWKRLLRCDILMSRRGAPLCHILPVSVSFAELANSRFHGLQIYISENVQFLRKDGLVSCLGPFKRRLLYEAAEDFVPTLPPYRFGEDDDHLSEKSSFGVQESVVLSECEDKPATSEGMTLNIDLVLPTCQDHSEDNWMHFSTEYKSARVYHWLDLPPRDLLTKNLLIKTSTGGRRTTKDILFLDGFRFPKTDISFHLAFIATNDILMQLDIWTTSKKFSRMLSPSVGTTRDCVGVMSGIISDPAFNDMFTATKGDNTMQATVTAVYEVGCLFGAILALLFGDRTGRRWMVIAGATIMIVGVVIQVSAMPGSLPLLQFIFGRVITGIGNGMNTSTIPTYQAECSKTSNRGLLICIEGGIIAIGTAIAYWIDYGAHYGPQDLVWRFPIAFQVFFGIIIIVGMFYLPESPRYLIAHDKVAEGERVLAALAGTEIEDRHTQTEKNLILDSVRASGATKAKFSDLLTGGPSQHLRRMLVGSSSQMFQQISGCNAVIYYLPVLLEQSIGQSHNFALLIGGINMICYAIFATFSWFFIEKIGRRKLFLGGSYGQCAAMVIVFACLIPGDKESAKGAVFGFFLYMCFFGATWLPLPWLYPAELSPIKTRAKANAISTCNNWLFNFTVVMITPVMVEHIGWGTYLFFAAWNAVFIPIIWLFYPETAGRSLEEIDLIFAKGYVEKMSYVRAAKELPKLSDDEIEAKAAEYGILNNNEKVEERIAEHAPQDSQEYSSYLPSQL